LRADNADQRLTARGVEIGCVGAARAQAFAQKAQALAEARAILGGLSLSPNEAARQGLKINQDGIRRTAFDLLGLPDLSIADLRAIWPGLGAIGETTAQQIEIDAKYAVYLARQGRDIEAFRRDEVLEIPEGLDYALLSGLSNEIRGRLELIRPRTMGQAGRIEGMTPAAMTLLASKVRHASAGR
jgi:tRNA uridine 5-carboxymethylaminomethyl modification enzyme